MLRINLAQNIKIAIFFSNKFLIFQICYAYVSNIEPPRVYKTLVAVVGKKAGKFSRERVLPTGCAGASLPVTDLAAGAGCMVYTLQPDFRNIV